jgi:hypothetical protein
MSADETGAPTREEIRAQLTDASRRLREHSQDVRNRVSCACDLTATKLDALSESIVGLLEDRERWQFVRDALFNDGDVSPGQGWLGLRYMPFPGDWPDDVTEIVDRLRAKDSPASPPNSVVDEPSDASRASLPEDSGT